MTILIALVFTSVVFKNDISVFLDRYKYGDIEYLRRCKDLGGLKDFMNNLQNINKHIESYNVYLYQPKNKAVYKQLVLYSELNVQGEVYLKDQQELSNALLMNEYVIYSLGQECEMSTTILAVGSEYLLVYKLESNKKTYGEIYIGLNQYPIGKERDALLKILRTVLFKYIV